MINIFMINTTKWWKYSCSLIYLLSTKTNIFFICNCQIFVNTINCTKEERNKIKYKSDIIKIKRPSTAPTKKLDYPPIDKKYLTIPLFSSTNIFYGPLVQAELELAVESCYNCECVS